ncbi:MAG: biopolymer transporter ExbD, partial [Planctomycetota bacterium]
MIDVVFLLLILFMLTLKITPPEGELDLAVPASAAANESPDPLLPPLRVELTADAGGGLASLTLDGADLGGGPDALERLHESV